MKSKEFFHIIFAIIILFALSVFGQDKGKGGKTIRLGVQKIEGKLKRPQVALISLERRPVFGPIALLDIKVKKDILTKIDEEAFECRIYTKPFPVAEK